MSTALTNILFFLFRLVPILSNAIFAPTGYVEYQPSTGLNVILSAPHGGFLQPADIPDRDAGCWGGNQCIWSHDCGLQDPTRCDAITAADLYTAELTAELRKELCSRCGKCPASIVNLLSRKKLDANREVNEATFGVPVVVKAFDEYHSYINAEKLKIKAGERGLFLDLHGHGHNIQRAELGYLLTGSQLNSIANITQANQTCIYGLFGKVGGSFDALLRGSNSFGGILESQSFESVPSPKNPGPGNATYFSGGYNVYTHGSLKGGAVDAIQIESPKSFREAGLRAQYVQALAKTVVKYLQLYYGNSSCKAQ